MNCPYCRNDNMPPPPDNPRPFGRCPDCGKKSRAAISDGKDGSIYVHYSATSLPKLPPDEVKTVHTIRLSKKDKREIREGKKLLTVCNGRVTIAV